VNSWRSISNCNFSHYLTISFPLSRNQRIWSFKKNTLFIGNNLTAIWILVFTELEPIILAILLGVPRLLIIRQPGLVSLEH